MKKPSYLYSAATAVLIGLAGCGNGTGTASAITGKAIDGYLNGATVCLDLNKSFVCDPAEPVTTTDENGTFILDIGEYNDTVLTGANLLAYGGTDIDTNETFEGILTAPFDANKDDFIITPLTTLVAAKVDSNGSIENAKTEVAASLGIDPKDLDKDPIAEEDLALMEMALEYEKALELLAAAIGEDNNVSASIAYVSEVLSPYFDGRKTTLIDAVRNLDLSESGYDEVTLARIEEAKSAIMSIAHRLDAHGVVTEAEIRAKIRKMGRDAEKLKDRAMVKIKDDEAEFTDSDLDADSQESAETETATESDEGKQPKTDNPNKPVNPKTENQHKPEKKDKMKDDTGDTDSEEAETSL